jgi:hypothetical protein
MTARNWEMIGIKETMKKIERKLQNLLREITLTRKKCYHSTDKKND